MMINEYLKQAQDFLCKTNTTCEIRYTGKAINEMWHDKELRNFYQVTLSNRKGMYTYTFWDSVYNTEKKKKPDEYDVLACLMPYEVGTFADFCGDFGYDTDSISALKTYMAVQKEYDGLRGIFTPEQMEMLGEIV